MICRHKLYHFTVANTRFTAPLTRCGKTKFATIIWYKFCLQIIQSQKCYPLNIIICKKRHSALLGVWYVTAYRCVGGLKKKLDLRSGSQRQRHFVGFFNVPVQAPTRGHPFLHGYLEKPPHLVAFYDTLGIRRTHSRLNPPPCPHGGKLMKWRQASVCPSICLSVCPVSWPLKCFK